MKNEAFVATVNGEGFGIGLAERDEPGYWPQVGFGTFPSYESASARAAELNATLGLSAEEACDIVCSSMRPSRKAVSRG